MKPYKAKDIWKEKYSVLATMLERMLAGEDMRAVFLDYDYKPPKKKENK